MLIILKTIVGNECITYLCPVIKAIALCQRYLDYLDYGSYFMPTTINPYTCMW
jgi:hypothetical protein